MYAAVTAIAALVMTSCQKEEGIAASDLIFTATIENSAKTHLDGMNLKWDNGDAIMVFDAANNHATYNAFNLTNDGTCAEFAAFNESTTFTSNNYHVLYPADCYNSTSGVILPETQQYAANSIVGFPMYAETHDNSLHFNNLCGVFRLNLTKPGITVNSISITTDKTVCGSFILAQTTDGKYVINAGESTDNNTITLDCGEGVDISTAKDFNIYLPAGEYAIFDITITATDGSTCTKSLSNNQTLTISRNEIVTLTRANSELEFVQPFPVTAVFDGQPLDLNCYTASIVSGEFDIYAYDALENPTVGLYFYMWPSRRGPNAWTLEFLGGNVSFADGTTWEYIDGSQTFTCTAYDPVSHTASFELGVWLYDITISNPNAKYFTMTADNITFTE